MTGRRRGYGVQGLRLCRVLDRLRGLGGDCIALDTLAREFGVCTRTIRRDINALATVYPVKRAGSVGANDGASVVWMEGSKET